MKELTVRRATQQTAACIFAAEALELIPLGESRIDGLQEQ